MHMGFEYCICCQLLAASTKIIFAHSKYFYVIINNLYPIFNYKPTVVIIGYNTISLLVMHLQTTIQTILFTKGLKLK